MAGQETLGPPLQSAKAESFHAGHIVQLALQARLLIDLSVKVVRLEIEAEAAVKGFNILKSYMLSVNLNPRNYLY